MATARPIPTITYATAARIVADAIGHAASLNERVAAVVVDPGGHVVAAGRMDGASAAVLDFATDKAYTAAMLEQPTRDVASEMIESRQQAYGALSRPRLCAWDGGLPIREGGVIIGAVGVSGAPGEIDIACGEAALTAAGLA